MEHVSSSYEYLFVGGSYNIYTFKSQFDASYEVRFKPGPDLVDNPAYADRIFELVIALVGNPYVPKLPPVDALMSVAIARIVEHFFANHERVIVYVCDDSDSRADARRKLFDGWFRRFSERVYVKLQVPLAAEGEPAEYTAEFVTRLDNPNFMDVYASFRRAVLGIK